MTKARWQRALRRNTFNAEEAKMDENKKVSTLENQERRKLCKTIVGGVTAVTAYHYLPARWTAPLIESIVLPAHAATSGTALFDPCTVIRMAGTQSTDSVRVRVNGYVTPAVGGLSTEIVATPTGAGSPVIVYTTTLDDGTFTADINITGGPGITEVAVQTTVDGASGSATCSVTIPASTTSSGPAYTIENCNFEPAAGSSDSILISNITGHITVTNGTLPSSVILTLTTTTIAATTTEVLSGTATIDASGNFTMPATGRPLPLLLTDFPTSLRIIFSFQDQATYGNDTDDQTRGVIG